MKRQKVRKGILLISFLLFPLTIYYMSPYFIVQGAAEGIVTGSFILFSAMLLGSLFFGRAFCGWVCPAAGLQECAMLASDKKAKGGKFNFIKFILWIPWISAIAILAAAEGGYKSIDFFYHTINGISVASPGDYFIYYGVIILILAVTLLSGKRGFCHYVCWMAPFMIIGTKLREKLHIPSLHLKAEQGKCIGCKQCSKKCPMSLEVESMVRKGCMNNSECILCGECIDTCPKSVIRYRVGRNG